MSVSKTILEIPKSAKAILVLAHGAGAGMHHASMTALANALNEVGVATLRFQFPYMEKGSKRPDKPDVAIAAIASAVLGAKKAAPKLLLCAGGKSFGGRMTTQAAAKGNIPDVKKILCFGFPLHPAKKPATSRADHLSEFKTPTLFLNGTRDDLSDMGLLKEVVAKNRHVKLHVLDGANHGFEVLKSSGRTNAEVLTEIAKAAAEFIFK